LHDGGCDEVTQLGTVHDVQQNALTLSFGEDGLVGGFVFARVDGQIDAVQVARTIGPSGVPDAQRAEVGGQRRGDDGDVGSRIDQAASLVGGRRAATQDHAGATLDVEEGGVVAG